MSTQNLYCCVCGNIPIFQNDASINNCIPDRFMHNLSIMLDNGQVLHGCEMSRKTRNVLKKDGVLYTPMFNNFLEKVPFHNPNSSVFVHTLCHQFVAEEFNVELNLSHLPIFENKLVVQYGEINKYKSSGLFPFIFSDMLNDGNMWMTEAPSRCGTKNWLRLMSILSQFNLPAR